MLQSGYLSCVAGIWLLLQWTEATSLAGRQSNFTSICKSIPGDRDWPSRETWAALNQSVNGRLIATEPQGAVCHPAGFGTLSNNDTACAALKAAWDTPAPFKERPGEVYNHYFKNASCSPFYDTDKPCELGNMVSYSIAVHGAGDVVAGINFAKENNVRLVIKNTGHDFNGKSTAKGGLALWTRSLQGMELIRNYKSKMYSGAAVKISAGHTAAEVLVYAHKYGYRAVTGDCPSVGIAGGYASGGGHGYLTSKHGMGADQILELQVVTADGRQLTVSSSQHADLYKALAGGGAGTYAVVLSMTYKVHPDVGGVGAAALSFNNTAASSDAYRAGIAAFWQWLPSLVDTGATVAFNVVPGKFMVYNTTAPDQSAADLDILYEPYLAKLRNLSVPYTYQSWTAPTYFEHYNNTHGPLPDGPYTASPLFNSRIIPRAVTESPERAANVSQIMIDVTEIDPKGADWQYGCMALNVGTSKFFKRPDNGVVPYWRNAIAICLQYSLYNWTIPQSEMLKRKAFLADVVHPPIVAATPDSGSYLNEADPLVYPKNDPGKWQKAMYGQSHFAKLRRVKDRWDPGSVFYAFSAVGSEDWMEDEEGRLCRLPVLPASSHTNQALASKSQENLASRASFPSKANMVSGAVLLGLLSF